MSLVVNSPAEGSGPRIAAEAAVPATTEYHFLLGRFIDTATLARASALAAQWGVHPHDVLIANGWLNADDYYRALAETCGTPFKPALTPAEAVPPRAATPRQCLANGLLRERARTRHFVLAPDRLRPNALRAVLAQLAPYGFALVAAMGLALLALRRRKLFGLSWQVLLMPLYWLLISVATYRAVWQFATAPFKWEKTEHGRSRGRANPSPE